MPWQGQTQAEPECSKARLPGLCCKLSQMPSPTHNSQGLTPLQVSGLGFTSPLLKTHRLQAYKIAHLVCRPEQQSSKEPTLLIKPTYLKGCFWPPPPRPLRPWEASRGRHQRGWKDPECEANGRESHIDGVPTTSDNRAVNQRGQRV